MFFSSFTSFSNAWGARRGPEGGLMVIYKIWADQLNGLFHLYPHVRVFPIPAIIQIKRATGH